MINLITRTQLRRHLGFPADLPDDPRLPDVIQAASHIITMATHRHFIPFRATETLKAHEQDQRIVATARNLMEIIELSDDTGTLDLNTIDATGGHIERIDGLMFSGMVTVTAIYGDHDEPASVWLPVTELTATLNTGQTVISVDDVTGVDVLTGQALFDVGQLLRIDDEFVRLDTINTGADTLTVTRGMRGTVAAEHAIGATVSVYTPPPDAVSLCLRVATLLYRDPDIHGQNLLDAVKRDLDNRRRPRVI